MLCIQYQQGKGFYCTIAVSALSKHAMHESATDMVYIDSISGRPVGTMLFNERSWEAR
jgi:hypothetical protein